MEYSSMVLHSQMSKYLSNLLEKNQKRALRAIFGWEKTYCDLLTESGLETLEKRREVNLRKFAENTVQNPKYSSRWFSQKEVIRRNINTPKYQEEKACGNRLFNSPIF